MTSFFRSMFGGSSAPASMPKHDPVSRAIAAGDIAQLAFIAEQAKKAPQQGSRPRR